MEFELMTTKKKYKSGKLTPMTERILIDALILWQQEFIKVIKTQGDGKRSMFHPNWTAVMLREFGIEFGVEELANTEPIND
jgi:hypothetical protein